MAKKAVKKKTAVREQKMVTKKAVKKKALKGTGGKPTTIDEYLATVGDKERKVLQALRKTIHAAAPHAEECISYGLAAFKENGMLIGFGASKNHCSLYPMNGTFTTNFQDLLRGYKTSAGAIQFTVDKPLPVALVKKIVQLRLHENLEHAKSKPGK